LLRRQNRSGARTAPMLSKLTPVQCVRPIQVVDSRDSGDRLFLSIAPWWWEARPSSLHGDPPLLFALAVYALPLFAAVTAGLAIYHTGSGPFCAAPDARQGITAAVISLDPLTWLPRQG